MNKDLQAISNLIQQSGQLTEEEKKAIAKSLKDANKELEITTFKLDRTEKVKKTTAILLEETIEELEQKRKAVEAQNKELEIETSLERIRTVAMGMRKADDLLDVCQALFAELRTLGFDELRNAMINIFNNDSISFLNYDYSDNAGKTITSHYYNSHPVIEKQVNEVKSSRDAFSETVFSGKDLEEWRAFRKEKGEKDDPKLDSIAALFYYFYAIGTGAIGISTYSSITNEKRNVLKRFRNVFDLAYRRFIDIENAEAQAREAQIEASLERVRSKTMAMHSSEDVGDTVAAMFNEFVRLGIQTNRCGISIFSDETSPEVWTAKSNPEGKANLIIGKLDLTVHALLHEIHKAWKKKEAFYTYTMEGDDLRNYYQSLNGLEYYPVKFDMSALPLKEFHSSFYFPEGSVFAFTGQLIPEEHTKIIKRFAGVFGQTYRRYLDLQKAEEQARESQIQLALERVRARTMAMQHSNELPEAAQLLFQQVQSLGMPAWSAGYCIWDEDKKAITLSMSRPWGDIQPSFRVPLDEDPSFIHFLEAHNKGEELFIEEISGNALAQNYKYLRTLPVVGEQLDAIIKEGNSLPTYQVNHCAYFSKGFLLFITYEQVPQSHKIFKRFANVFDQTYTRFLDLQKAEAQARESQIELGLERVRAKAMAMQNSEELNALIGTVFTELTKLDLVLTRCVIIIYDTKTNGGRWWMANSEAPSEPMNFLVKHSEHPPSVAYLKAWQQRTLKWEYPLQGAIKKEWDDFLFSETELSQLPDFVISGMKAPDKVYLNASFNNFGNLTLASLEPLSEEHFGIMLRFAKVFDLTYTRFNDLQKAEAQARESQIQLGLERVRARTMAMQKSEELMEAANLLFQQVQSLGIPVWSCGYNIWEKEDKVCTAWMSVLGDIQPSFRIPLTEHRTFIRMYESRLKAEPFYTEEVSGEELADHYKYMFSLPDFREIVTKQLQDGSPLPQSQVHNVFNFKHGNLIFLSGEAIPGAWDIFKRFSAVFEQTYTRFLDLQKAEAQVLEAIKRASVDRVRAEIASMRTTNDLERITPLIWNELTTLGVPFIRCGVFIMDEEKQQVQTFLYTEGKTIASFTSTFSNSDLIVEALPYWRRKEIYKTHWDEAAFLEQARNLVEQGSITSGEKYLTEHRPTNLYLHFLPFLQGMLYVGDAASLSNEHLQLVQALAEAFSTAYARYEDFNKLESAKKQVDSTLTELQATQKQLIQSEKMASLGELTAGIAHEIQNPLNFVNNFSEVSKELIEELESERSKAKSERDETMEVEILNDIKQNLEKINHHGKRADAIVKGMLQHSRSTGNEKQPTDINALADEYLRLAYHGLRAKDKSFNATLITDYDEAIGKINIIPQDIGRVILNVITNAFYAVNEKKKSPRSLKGGMEYEPIVSIITKRLVAPLGDGGIEIKVVDNGTGIPQKVVDKIFQPFFTTKPTGQGTGLGLSLAYDIVKAHGGELKVESREGEGAAFIVGLPILQN